MPNGLAAQLHHQIRLARRRMTWWIPLIFVLGFVVSILGLVASLAESRLRGSPTPSLWGFGIATICFGWVAPLSAFGFAYDNCGQEVRWHPAAEGLATVEALRRGLTGQLSAASDVAQDLEALTFVIGAAADRGVDFSLVLRLFAKDSIQAVCTREVRQGSFS